MVMKETHCFLVPDYFPRFACKVGSCRAACCQGWPVSVSMQNYFRLLGLDCRPELRRQLDCGLRPVDRPDADEYARFTPRYDGDCPHADARRSLLAARRAGRGRFARHLPPLSAGHSCRGRGRDRQRRVLLRVQL